MKKKVVCIICPWFDPYRIPLLSRISYCFDIYIIYTMPKEQGREWCIPNKLPLNVIFLKPRLVFKTKMKKMFGEKISIYYPSGLISTIKKINPDVVIGLEFRISSIIGCLWSIINRRKYITWSDMTRYYDMHMDLLRIMNRKFILFFSHTLIGSSSDTINHFNDDFGFPRDRSFLSILSAHIQERVSFNSIKKGRKIGDEKIKFLYVGEILKRKGVHFLIKAFSEVAKKYKNVVQLTIVGKGRDRELMENMTRILSCEESILFIGSIPYEDVPKEMVSHDVLVFPTLIDAFGLVVAEAAACGLPIICSRYAGAANDLVKKNGVIVNPENIEELISAMELMICDPQLMARMTIEGELIMRKNSMTEAVSGYLDAINTALNNFDRTNQLCTEKIV
jgi:glycosyltransferase involved in cell wall biosynthesis